MDYRPILSFDPKWVVGMLDYFVEKQNNMLSSLQYIEAKSNLIQQKFDIENPNITLYVGDYIFDKESSSINIGGAVNLELNDQDCIFNGSSESITIYNNSVLHKDDVEASRAYISEYFLDKDIFSNNVNWGYDLESLNLDALHVFDGNDILPYSFALQKFYLLQKENFKTLSVESEDETTRDGVVSYGTLEREINSRSSTSIRTDTQRLVGDTVEVVGDDVYLTNDININSSELNFRNGYIFHEESPISREYANSTYIRGDLSGITSIYVDEKDISDREENELITKRI